MPDSLPRKQLRGYGMMGKGKTILEYLFAWGEGEVGIKLLFTVKIHKKKTLVLSTDIYTFDLLNLDQFMD